MDRQGNGLGDLSTALVLASPMDPRTETVCLDHLTAGETSPDRVLSVLFTGRPERQFESWDRHVGERPEPFVVLSTQRPGSQPEDADVRLLDRPGDLTDIGVAVTDCLADWPSDGRTAFCLNSLTAQLQYVDERKVYQFLHTLLGHFQDREVVGHAHLNPAAHDRETVDTFKTLFDGVVEVREDGHTVSASR